MTTSSGADRLRAIVADRTILAIGDSSARHLDGIVVESAAATFGFKARWQPALYVGDLYADGCFSEYLTRILMEMRLVRRSTEQRWPFPRLAMPERPGESTWFAPRNPRDATLLFCCGMSELGEIGGRAPFADLEDDAAYDAKLARTRAEAAMTPLFDAIRALRACGFEDIVLHALVAPPRGRRLSTWLSPTLHARLVTTFNELFADFAASGAVQLFSMGDVLAPEGWRLAEYDFDSIHLNRQAGTASARALCARLGADDRARSARE